MYFNGHNDLVKCRILKELAVGLADSDTTVVQLTEGTLWGIFHRSGNDKVDELLQVICGALQQLHIITASNVSEYIEFH
jgi:hypothetical protein